MGPGVVGFRWQKVRVSPDGVRLPPEAGPSAWVDEVLAVSAPRSLHRSQFFLSHLMA